MLSDKDLNDYIVVKRRSTNLPKKSVVQVFGKQSDRTWVLGNSISPSGALMMISQSGSSHVWIT